MTSHGRGRSTFVLALVLGVAVAAAGSITATRAAGQSSKLRFRGSVDLSAIQTSGAAVSGSRHATRPHTQRAARVFRSTPQKAAHPRGANAPGVDGGTLAHASASPGFEGINDLAQASAGTGSYVDSQFSLEPPDQALCVSGNRVVESVNNALQVFKLGGKPVTPPVALNQFFDLAPEQDSTTGLYGDFTSDPKCYHDGANGGHWFLTQLQLGVDPVSGAFSGTSELLLAVSGTDDPAGVWNLYSIDTTNEGGDGTGCPCFGDQPLIGADANGFYITTNSYQLFGPDYYGVELYAMSKSLLEAGGLPALWQQEVTTLAEGQAYSLQPATSPNGVYDSSANGTEYFLSSLDFDGTGDSRIAAWALTNTGSLNTGSPSLLLSSQVLPSESYSMPPPARQIDGSRPLGELLGDPVNALETNDDRMNQVVYAAGRLWSGLNTAVHTHEGTHAGIAYFAVKPSVSGGVVSAKLKRQGYLAVDKVDLMFPSIGVNGNGAATAVFSASGPKLHPSVAIANLQSTGVTIVAPGAGVADGFSGYPTAFGGDGVERWGDYSAAVAAPDGSIWAAAEFVSAERTFYANWGTYILHVSP
jgi:hypothetical protein